MISIFRFSVNIVSAYNREIGKVYKIVVLNDVSTKKNYTI